MFFSNFTQKHYKWSEFDVVQFAVVIAADTKLATHYTL